MLDRNRVRELIKLSLKPIDMMEVGIYSHVRGTTRFANSVIHQNLSVEYPYFWTRIVIDTPRGKKIGGTSCTQLTIDDIRRTVARALEIAHNSTPDKRFVSLPKPEPHKGAKATKPVDIEEVTPEERARAVKKIVKVAQKYNLDVAGVIHTNVYSLGVANSLGIDQFGLNCDTYTTVTAMSKTSSGYSLAMARYFNKIDFEQLAEIACQKALLSQNPQEITPGKYTVLLEPHAVAEMISFLGWLEFGAKAFAEKRSIISKSLGQKITGSNITIYDDFNHPQVNTFPFDYEGVMRKKVTFIEKGVAKGVVFDSFYAHLLKKPNTGHALPAPNPHGPFPSTLILQPGNIPLAKMLGMIEKGILITRFWYTRVVDPDTTTITGLTRDGTFWVENGEIKYGIKNLRFTINIYEVLKNVLAISKETVLSGEFTQVVAPALLIKDFEFTGKTEY
ncbi:MAG: TldD/PmbA family protein [candidate division WOR-3 bacterium]|nr:TldD/PmbA family protein [candidate division WOR-3 bacterium]MCX7757757.1 TldD/PmbA family protein [candidate division WOR-3 bacterium]MDW7987506.1 TldD/PmbA family protein [candidate division WOR-3 bacterium]